ncbi:hypothetical protein N7450_003808 [Penicillium hetheringtonii]|uniref:Uncharacterized protein n=1 Tax=Penicillium hetheringtonii TaxID=911720 RepID=A0AAD6DP46_9EURO|nr:hypothetical protein N7450_003808 [Penicillium hetheringtonii]
MHWNTLQSAFLDALFQMIGPKLSTQATNTQARHLTQVDNLVKRNILNNVPGHLQITLETFFTRLLGCVLYLLQLVELSTSSLPHLLPVEVHVKRVTSTCFLLRGELVPVLSETLLGGSIFEAESVRGNSATIKVIPSTQYQFRQEPFGARDTGETSQHPLSSNSVEILLLHKIDHATNSDLFL